MTERICVHQIYIDGCDAMGQSDEYTVEPMELGQRTT
jgi:hypothetical protein